MSEKIGKFLDALHKRVGVNNNECVRLYATGIFQRGSQPEQTKLMIQILEGQKLKNRRDGWRLQYEQMERYKQSDAIIVCNPAGLTDQGVLFEFGFMVVTSKRTIFTEKPKKLSIVFPYEIGLNF